jgi:hypothetical protein
LTPAAPGRRDQAHESAAWDEPEEIKDSAFWEAYADRTGIPAAGLIEVAPLPEGGRGTSHAVDPDASQTPRRRRLRHSAAPFEDVSERRQRGQHAWPDEKPERRPVRIVVVSGTVLIMALTAVFLGTKFWPGRVPGGAPSIAPPDGQAVASRPILDPVPVPAEPAAPSEPAAAPEPPAPTGSSTSAEPAAPTPAAPTEPRAIRSPADPPASAAITREPTGRAGTGTGSQEAASRPGPTTSVERMAAFLIGRDGPEGAMQTALAVARFYRPNTDDFKYWQGVAAAIRASTTRTAEPGEAAR